VPPSLKVRAVKSPALPQGWRKKTAALMQTTMLGLIGQPYPPKSMSCLAPPQEKNLNGFAFVLSKVARFGNTWFASTPNQLTSAAPY
jgi:hypothetical protein